MSPGSTEVMELLQDPAATAGQKIQVMEPWTKDLGQPFKIQTHQVHLTFPTFVLKTRIPKKN